AQGMPKRQPAVPMEKASEREVLLEVPSASTARTSSMRAQRQPAFSIEKAPGGEVLLEASSPSVTQTSRMRTPGVPLNISPAIEHGKNTTPPARSQKS